MIVMKFGGSSLASSASISRVVSIVEAEIERHPVVVVSAIGDTTDCLAEILAAARHGNSYSAFKLQEALKQSHFAICDAFLHGEEQHTAEEFLRNTFRDLHVRMLELAEGERAFAPELQDWTLSIGEQLSSRLLAAILQRTLGPTAHFDSRKLILTNDTFTNAQPRYWETYARLRWAIPSVGNERVSVLGGFIGSAEDGRTTTLGRGGSDLTASIAGAALNAEEIQIWKDVDGLMSCDPRLLAETLQVRQLSYLEASELARAGATILHPETMTPAKRLRIPITIRNTFCPDSKGTTINADGSAGTDAVKSIAVRNGIHLLQFSARGGSGDINALIRFCKENSSDVTVLGSSQTCLYVAVEQNAQMSDSNFASDGCFEVSVWSEHAVITLVGENLDRQAVSERLACADLHRFRAFIVPAADSPSSLRVAVPSAKLEACLDLIHQAFFTHVDPRLFFAARALESRPALTGNAISQRYEKRSRSFMLSTKLLHAN